jgi:hypothetical protein
MDRFEAENLTGHPAWPCAHCGHDVWRVHQPWRRAKTDFPCLFPAICGHCHIIETAHHNDGMWMGMHHYSKYPGGLSQFVAEHSEYLMETT